MMIRYLPAKLFFASALVSFVVGVALNRNGVPGFLLWFPVSWFVMLRLIPFAVSGVSSAFGMIYLGSERFFSRKPNMTLAIAHLITFLVVVWEHVASLRELNLYLGDNAPNPNSFSLRPFDVTGIALIISLALFISSLMLNRPAPAAHPSSGGSLPLPQS